MSEGVARVLHKNLDKVPSANQQSGVVLPIEIAGQEAWTAEDRRSQSAIETLQRGAKSNKVSTHGITSDDLARLTFLHRKRQRLSSPSALYRTPSPPEEGQVLEW